MGIIQNGMILLILANVALVNADALPSVNETEFERSSVRNASQAIARSKGLFRCAVTECEHEWNICSLDYRCATALRIMVEAGVVPKHSASFDGLYNCMEKEKCNDFMDKKNMAAIAAMYETSTELSSASVTEVKNNDSDGSAVQTENTLGTDNSQEDSSTVSDVLQEKRENDTAGAFVIKRFSSVLLVTIMIAITVVIYASFDRRRRSYQPIGRV